MRDCLLKTVELIKESVPLAITLQNASNVVLIEFQRWKWNFIIFLFYFSLDLPSSNVNLRNIPLDKSWSINPVPLSSFSSPDRITRRFLQPFIPSLLRSSLKYISFCDSSIGISGYTVLWHSSSLTGPHQKIFLHYFLDLALNVTHIHRHILHTACFSLNRQKFPISTAWIIVFVCKVPRLPDMNRIGSNVLWNIFLVCFEISFTPRNCNIFFKMKRCLKTSFWQMPVMS